MLLFVLLLPQGQLDCPCLGAPVTLTPLARGPAGFLLKLQHLLCFPLCL
jgi:hypothetical protein